MSRILVTGNPNYEGLCKGIYEAYDRNRVEFIGRYNGWDMNDAKKVANYAKDFDVFVNSLYGPEGQQNRILEEVYKKFERGHIINVSSTSSYWESGDSPQNYIDNKTLLDDMSKKMSNDSCWGDSEIKVSNIAFGQLNSQSQKERNDDRNKISLQQAGQFIKWVIDSPTDINIHYVAMDPIQRDQ